jgi:hypothetical protein
VDLQIAMQLHRVTLRLESIPLFSTRADRPVLNTTLLLCSNCCFCMQTKVQPKSRTRSGKEVPLPDMAQ